MSDWKTTVQRLVEQRGAALFGYAYVLTGDRHAADDLVQDALIRTFSRARSGFSVDQAHAYVKRAIFTGFIDNHRRSTARPRTTELSHDPGQRDATEHVASALSVHAAVLSLPPRERACVVLRYLDDQPVATVARELGLAQGTVKRYLSDALTRLRTTHPDLADVEGALTGGTNRVDVLDRKATP